MEIWKRRLMETPRRLDLRLIVLVYLTAVLESSQAGKLGSFQLGLNGTTGSFAQLANWQAASSLANWTLSFDFRTNTPSGLLLYADDNSKRSFLQLRLQAGQVECQIQTVPSQAINGALPGVPVTRVGYGLNDNQWHTVVIGKVTNVVIVRVQTISTAKEVKERLTLPGAQVFSGPAKIFLGGLPGSVSTHFSVLAHPSVVIEERFQGEIRSVWYATDSDGSWPWLLPGSGANLEPEASLCSADTLDEDMVFSGKEFLHFTGLPPPGDPTKMTSEMVARFSLQFRSRRPNGFLAHLRLGWKFSVSALLSDDVLVLAIVTPSGGTKTTCQNEAVKSFSDYSLHNLTLELQNENTKMVISLDGEEPCWMVTLPEKDQQNKLGFTEIYLGNGPGPSGDVGNGPETANGFQGSLTKVTLRGGALTSSLHEARQNSASLGSVPVEHGSGIAYRCQSVRQSHEHIEFQFCSADMYLAVPAPENRKRMKITLQMKTVEPDGLIVFYRHYESQTFTAVDLFDGNVNVYVHRGETANGHSGSPRITVPSSRINDGQWHNFTVSVDVSSGKAGRGFVTLDDAETEFVIAIPEIRQKSSDSPGEIYFGGAPYSDMGKLSDFWSVQLNHSFRGVLKDIRVNNEPLDDDVIARWNDDTCPTFRDTRHCSPNPCFNSGVCREGWQRHLCDCEKTGFTGATCQTESLKMDFNGTFFLEHQMPLPLTERQLTDIAFRFQTLQTSTVLLKATECPHPGLKGATTNSLARVLLVLLRHGRVVVRLSLISDPPEDPFICEWGAPGQANDLQWHSVKFARRGPLIRLTVDDNDVTESISALEGMTWSFCRVEIGNVLESGKHVLNSQNKRGKRGRTTLSSKKDRTHTGRKSAPREVVQAYVGSMQGLQFDWRDVSQSNNTHTVPIRKISEEERLNVSTYSFQTSAGYLELETLNAETQFDVKFSVRTGEANGLLMYNGKTGKDFVAIEIVRGKLAFTFDLGSGAQTIMSSQTRPLSDKKWHDVHITRPKTSEYVLSVDQVVYQTASPDKVKSKLDLSGKLYLGGLPKSDFVLLPRNVVSRHGFTGCIRELTLNHLQPDLAEVAKQQAGSAVVAGCVDSGDGCRADSCKHGGECEHQGNGVLCDCDMTSYSGPVCEDYSISYRFGPVPGLIIYHFDPTERLDSRNDHIAFSVITLDGEAIIGRVASFTSNDLIEFEIVDGHLFVIYNMGKKAHVINDLKHRLNDGQYHVVRFNRSGANATIQIDNNFPITNTPTGPQLDVFNGISTVEIGGKLNSKSQDIERAFLGIISGFVLNGIRILDLAADNDSNIITDGSLEVVASLAVADEVKGAVGKVGQSWLDEMQHIDTTRSHEVTRPDNDDLIVATTPKCRDEDESCGLVDSSRSDDLIFAQFTLVKTSTAMPKTSTVSPPKANHVPCDDEDCDIESSGDDSLLSARAAVARTTRVFYVSFNTTTASSLTDESSLPNTEGKKYVESDNPAQRDGSVLRSPLVPVPTLATSEAAAFAVEYAAVIAGICIGIILLVGFCVFLAIRCRSRRTAAQRTGDSGKPAVEIVSKAGRGSVGQPTVRVNPRDGGGEVGGVRPPGYPGGTNSVGKNGKDREWCV